MRRPVSKQSRAENVMTRILSGVLSFLFFPLFWFFFGDPFCFWLALERFDVFDIPTLPCFWRLRLILLDSPRFDLMIDHPLSASLGKRILRLLTFLCPFLFLSCSRGSLHVLQLRRNIVATVNLGCKLQLKTIAMQARNAEYNPKVNLTRLADQNHLRMSTECRLVERAIGPEHLLTL